MGRFSPQKEKTMSFTPITEEGASSTFTVSNPVSEEEILRFALQLSRKRLNRGEIIDTPAKVYSHIRTLIQSPETESFYGLFLDKRRRVISLEKLFNGTIDNCRVYRREVVVRCLALNASSVILARNDTSIDPQVTPYDETLSGQLREALNFMDIEVLDHLIVAADSCISLREKQLL
jgi:DNA repair protein RadC